MLLATVSEQVFWLLLQPLFNCQAPFLANCGLLDMFLVSIPSIELKPSAILLRLVASERMGEDELTILRVLDKVLRKDDR